MGITQEQKAERLRLYDELGEFKAVADQLGINESSVRRSLTPLLRQRDAESKPIEFPEFVEDGDEEEPIEDLIARLSKGFERKHKAANARRWFPVKVRETKPYGIILFGDPHLGDNGCNMPLMLRHLEIAKRPGVYGINIGDTTNNWVGRLMRLYAEQETSSKTEKRLAEWFMFDAGVRWLCWILGNHDDWSGGADFQKRLGGNHIPVIDWRAQFKLVHDSGVERKIDASHGRKGKSIWNDLHGTLRDAKLGEFADLYVTGHTHNFALQDLEIAERRESAWLVQVRGYKFHDHYALTGGFPENQRGSAVFAIIDPNDPSRRGVQCFEDVEVGAEFLEWKRAKG